MQLPTEMEHYKSDIEDHEYQIKRYQRFNLKPNRENVGSVSKSRTLSFDKAVHIAWKLGNYYFWTTTQMNKFYGIAGIIIKALLATCQY